MTGESSTPKTLQNAAIGAVVTVLLSFTAISPVLGGAIAGYLQRESPRRGLRVGAISGALASIPVGLLLLLGMGTVLLGTTRGMMGMPGGLGLVVILFVMLPLLLLWNVGLSALGGYVGAAVRTGSRPQSGETAPPQHGD